MTFADPSHATHFCFAIDPQDPLRIIFGPHAILAQEREAEPVWQHETPTVRLLDAMIRWLSLRRDRWDAWGRLAELVGPPAIVKHMRQEMAAEPVATRPCTVIQYPDDPTYLLIGEMTHGAHGFAVQPLHQHRFATAAARERFRNWLDMSGDEGLDALLRGTLLAGATSVAAAIDRIAEGNDGDVTIVD